MSKRIESVRLYDYDSKEDFGYFECFHQATEFLNSHGYSVVSLKEYLDIKVQHWGLRKWNNTHNL